MNLASEVYCLLVSIQLTITYTLITCYNYCISISYGMSYAIDISIQ